jgi:rod shape-determining protein MreD
MDRLSGTIGGKFLAAIFPVSFGFFGAFAANLPISFLGPWLPTPLFSLMAVYFWCLVRPDLMSPAWAFLIGLMEDILSGGPPGVWAASYVATYAVIDRQRDAFAGLSGLGAMLGFATAALVACGTAYVAMNFYHWRLLPLSPVASEFAMTVLCYVPAAYVLGAVHHRIVGPLRSDF